MKTVLLGLLVLAAHVLEAVTGFGSTVMSMPFASLLIGFREAVRVLVSLTFLACGYIAVAERRVIQWRVYGTMLVLVGLGMPIGMWLFSAMDERLLTRALGAFAILIAVRGLWITARPMNDRRDGPVWRGWLLKGVLFAGGIVHGAFGCGGPLIVLYASEMLEEKRAFRATMCLNWTVLNAVHLIRYTVRGEWTAEIGSLVLWMLPFLALGVFIGSAIAGRISGKGFAKAVYLVLFGSGIFMFA